MDDFLRSIFGDDVPKAPLVDPGEATINPTWENLEHLLTYGVLPSSPHLNGAPNGNNDLDINSVTAVNDWVYPNNTYVSPPYGLKPANNPSHRGIIGLSYSAEASTSQYASYVAGHDLASPTHTYSTPSLDFSDGVSPVTYVDPWDLTMVNLNQELLVGHANDGNRLQGQSLPGVYPRQGTPINLNAAANVLAEGGHGGGHPEGVRPDNTNQEAMVQPGQNTSVLETRSTVAPVNQFEALGYTDPVKIYDQIMKCRVKTTTFESFFPKGQEHILENGNIVCRLQASLSKSGKLDWVLSGHQCGKSFPHEPSYRRHIEEQHFGRKRPRTKKLKATPESQDPKMSRLSSFEARLGEHEKAGKKGEEKGKRKRSDEVDSAEAGPSKKRHL
ncbi:hypothetical protein FRB91_001659 [Serendipita sp. 411]|nr:hypothetical protein FRC18_004035 [Serendipita sp. 400]KAG8845560.1 hypothetical protein FRB91_001659 [Serendipita sp. 411]